MKNWKIENIYKYKYTVSPYRVFLNSAFPDAADLTNISTTLSLCSYSVSFRTHSFRTWSFRTGSFCTPSLRTLLNQPYNSFNSLSVISISVLGFSVLRRLTILGISGPDAACLNLFNNFTSLSIVSSSVLGLSVLDLSVLCFVYDDKYEWQKQIVLLSFHVEQMLPPLLLLLAFLSLFWQMSFLFFFSYLLRESFNCQWKRCFNNNHKSSIVLSSDTFLLTPTRRHLSLHVQLFGKREWKLFWWSFKGR